MAEAQAAALFRELQQANRRPSPEECSQLASLTAQHANLFFSPNAANHERLLNVLVSMLNDESEPYKTKVMVLATLSNLCLVEERRDDMLDVLQRLGPALERTLDAKAQGQQQFNTSQRSDLHQAMLVAMCRVCDYSLRTSYLLEFVNNDVPFALQLLLGIIQVPSYETALICCAVKLLRGFSQPDAYFSADESKKQMTTQKVTAFANHIDEVMLVCMRDGIVHKICEALGPRLMGRPSALDTSERTALSAVHEFIQNVFLYSSVQRSTAFRQHLEVQVNIQQALIVPYVDNCVRFSPACGLGDEAQFLTTNPILTSEWAAALKTIVLATFRLGEQAQASARQRNPTPLLLRAPHFLRAHPGLLALVLLVNVNLDALVQHDSDTDIDHAVTTDPHHELFPASLADTISTVLRQLTPPRTKSTRGLLETKTALPVARDVTSYAMALHLLTAAERACFLDDDDEELDCGRMRSGSRASMSGKNEDNRESDDDDLASDSDNDAGAGAGAETDDDDCDADDRCMARLSTNAEAKDTKRFSFRLLGDLPDLTRPRSEAEQLTVPQLTEIKNEDDLPKGVPDQSNIPQEFQCAINGHLMKDPVRSPYGHVFERSSIEMWLQRLGPVCPLTEKRLEIADLEPARDLAEQITSWHIMRAMESNEESNWEDDPYSF